MSRRVKRRPSPRASPSTGPTTRPARLTSPGWSASWLGCRRRLPALGNAVAVVTAEAPGGILGEGVAVALTVRRSQERRDDLEVPLAHAACLAPEVGQAEVDVQLEELDPRRSLTHEGQRTEGIG